LSVYFLVGDWLLLALYFSFSVGTVKIYVRSKGVLRLDPLGLYLSSDVAAALPTAKNTAIGQIFVSSLGFGSNSEYFLDVVEFFDCDHRLMLPFIDFPAVLELPVVERISEDLVPMSVTELDFPLSRTGTQSPLIVGDIDDLRDRIL
jgi:hypothetical protein